MAAKKSAPAKKAAAKKIPARKPVRKSEHTGEVWAICGAALAILLMIAVYGSGGGSAGKTAHAALIGLFGFGGYLFPIILLAVSIYALAKRGASFHASKIILCILLFLCVISAAHVLTADTSLTYVGLGDYINANYTHGAANNGGLIGAMFGNVLLTVLGMVGSFVLLTAAVIVLFILITQKSFVGLLKKMGEPVKHAYETRRDAIEYEDDEPEEELLPPPQPRIKPAAPKKAPQETQIVTIEKPAKRPYEREKILLASEEITGAKKSRLVPPPPQKLSEKITLERPRQAEDSHHCEERDDVHDESRNTWIASPVTSHSDVRARNDDAPPWDDESAAALTDDEPEIRLRGMGLDDTGGSIFDEDYNPPDEFDDSPSPGKFNTAAAKPVNPAAAVLKEYIFPPVDLLNENPVVPGAGSRAQILENTRKLEDTLKSFGVEAKVIEVSKGPTVTRYELSPGSGVKVSKISGLADDLALNLAAAGIRIEAPIPGKAAVGIEVPNKETTTVYLREVIEDDSFKNFPSKLAFALGKDIAGNPVVTDIAKMPHMLIAGATGSGKSVCINTLITSIIYKAKPDEVKLLMVDPKVVELSVYNGVPHLLIPVVTDPKKAAGALNWAVQEMIARYNFFAQTSVRDLKGYNATLIERGEDPLPQIVIIIDELADLMMAAPGDVEEAICRLAQMARAAGLHLIIATQRPSVDVITGLIKANIPSRLAFSVSSGTDSRTILDTVGAEKLLGKGDMLFFPMGMSKPQRVQGAFISDKEVEAIVTFVKQNAGESYDQAMIDKITAPKTAAAAESDEDTDEFFDEAVSFLIEKEKASASMLQRQFRIGYNRASRLIEELEDRGIVGPEDGSKPRKVLMTRMMWEDYKSRSPG